MQARLITTAYEVALISIFFAAGAALFMGVAGLR